MSVRTKVLASFDDTGGVTSWWTVYTCPAGHTAIVKDYAITNRGGGARTVTLGVRSSVGEVRVHLGGLLAHLGSIVGIGRYIVLEPGNDLVIFVGGEVTSTLMDVHVSGVELEGVAP